MPQNKVTGGKTQNRNRRNRKRTVKAASTYGEAYQKYVRMYGGQAKDAEAENPPAPDPDVNTGEEQKEQKGFFSGLIDKFKGTSDDENNGKDKAVAKPDVETSEETATEEESGVFDKITNAFSKTTDTVKAKATEVESDLTDAKTKLDSATGEISKTFDNVRDTVSRTTDVIGSQVSETASKVAETVADNPDESGQPLEEADSKDVISDSNSKSDSESSSSSPADAAATGAALSNDSALNSSSSSSSTSAIAELADETVASSVKAAEDSLKTLEDALKALQLAVIAARTVVNATKASVVANASSSSSPSSESPSSSSSSALDELNKSE